MSLCCSGLYCCHRRLTTSAAPPVVHVEGGGRRDVAARLGWGGGYKWSRFTGDHGNDLWLIVVSDRHAALKVQRYSSPGRTEHTNVRATARACTWGTCPPHRWDAFNINFLILTDPISSRLSHVVALGLFEVPTLRQRRGVRAVRTPVQEKQRPRPGPLTAPGSVNARQAVTQPPRSHFLPEADGGEMLIGSCEGDWGGVQTSFRRPRTSDRGCVVMLMS